MFYFSSMMMADAEALATDSSLSTHPASVSACMALPQAREARPQTREARPPQALVARYDAAATAPVPAWSNSPLLIELNWSGELLNCLGQQLAPSGQARLVKHRVASPVSGGLDGPPSRVICRKTAHRKPSEEWRKW